MGRFRFGLNLRELQILQFAAHVIYHWHTCAHCGPRWLHTTTPPPDYRNHRWTEDRKDPR